jgi:hypothetical protein
VALKVRLNLDYAIKRYADACVNETLCAMLDEVTVEDLALVKEKKDTAKKHVDVLVRAALRIVESAGEVYKFTEYFEEEDGMGEFDVDEYSLAVLMERVSEVMEDDEETKFAA